MGQSQSLGKYFSKDHIKAEKTFSLMFFQSEFNNVVYPKQETIEKKYKMERHKHITAIKMKDYKSMPFEEWIELQERLIQEYDSCHKEKRIAELDRKFKPMQMMGDLKDTVSDAQIMFDFMQTAINKNLSELTVMCEDKYLNKFEQEKSQNQTLFELIVEYQNEWLQHQKQQMNLKWDSAGPCNDWLEHKMLEKQFFFEVNLERQQFNDERVLQISTGKAQMPKIKIEEFTQNQTFSSVLIKEIKRRIYSYIIPEATLAYKKLEASFVYQFLTKETRKNLQKNRMFRHCEPSRHNYHEYNQDVLAYAEQHPTKGILSLQVFAGHGMIVNGLQSILTNCYSHQNKFYEFINVEQEIRLYAPKMVNVFFLIIFACCREYFTPMKKIGECLKHGPSCKGCSPKNYVRLYKSLPKPEQQIETRLKEQNPNFTLIFGCNPESGVVADTNLIEAFIDHLKMSFSANDGTLTLPACLSQMQADKAEFESTSNNEGRGLKLFRQDCKVGLKFIVIITQAQDLSDSMKVAKKTFMKQLGFKEEEIIQLNLQEAYQLARLFQFNQPQLNCTKLTTKLQTFAEKFLQGYEHITNPMLQIFLVETSSELHKYSDFNQLRNFILFRNPELALLIYPESRFVKKYFNAVKIFWKESSFVHFDDFNGLFQNKPGIVENNGMGNNKPYSGTFKYFIKSIKAADNSNQSINEYFNMLKVMPVRIFETNKHSIGFAISNTESIIIQVEQNYFQRLKRQRTIKQKFSTLIVDQLSQLDFFEQRKLNQYKQEQVDQGECIYTIQLKKIKFLYPYTVTNLASLSIKNSWTLHQLHPIHLLHHSQVYKVAFFTMNYNQNIDELGILRISYGSDQVQIQEFKMPFEQEKNVTVHACQDAEDGIYVYVFRKLKDNHESTLEISVHHIKEDKILTLTQPNTRLQDFISQYDPHFVQRILKLRGNFFEILNPQHLRSKNFDPYQIVYAKNTISFIFDLKMGGGKLMSYSKYEVIEGKAIGIQLFPKAYSIQLYSNHLGCLILEKDCRTQVIYNVELKDLQNEQFEKIKQKYEFKDFSPDDRQFLKVMPIPDVDDTEYSEPQFCFVFRKTSVQILHMSTQFTFKIIIQQVHHSHDRICDFFITGEIPNLTLHYFELVHNSRGKFKFRSYNVFYMFEDFWKSLKAYNGKPPMGKKQLIMDQQNNKKLNPLNSLMSQLPNLRQNKNDQQTNQIQSYQPETPSSILEKVNKNKAKSPTAQTSTSKNKKEQIKMDERFALLEQKLKLLEAQLTSTQGKLEDQIKYQEQKIEQKVNQMLYARGRSPISKSNAKVQLSSLDVLQKAVKIDQNPFLVPKNPSPRSVQRLSPQKVEKKSINGSYDFQRRVQHHILQIENENQSQKSIEINQLLINEKQNKLKSQNYDSLISVLTAKFNKMLFESNQNIYEDFISKGETLKQMESLKQQVQQTGEAQQQTLNQIQREIFNLQKETLKIETLELKLQEYSKLANIKRRDNITTSMSREWHADLTSDMLTDPEKLKEYVQEEVFLCFQRQFQETSHQINLVKHKNPKTDKPKQILDIGVKLIQLEARQRQMVNKIREQSQTLNPQMISLQTISMQTKLKSRTNRMPLELTSPSGQKYRYSSRPESKDKNQIFPNLSLILTENVQKY